MHFNVQLGVTDACCIDCTGYCELVISLSSSYNPISSFDAVVGQSIQLYALAFSSDGTLHDFTGSCTWSSSNTGIATVETLGQTTPGLYTAVAGGSSTIKASRSLNAQGVHYSICGGCPGLPRMSGQATANVQKPTFLLLKTQLSSSSGCANQGTTTCLVQRFYRVLDQNSNPISVSGLDIRESMSPPSGSCSGNLTDRGAWTTDATGSMTSPDVIYWCCAAKSNCYVSFEQGFTVNGYPVLISDNSGLPPAIHNVIKFTCTSGTGSCPQMYPSP